MGSMKDVRKYIGEDEHDQRMAAARARAEWELGDASWAGLIVGAYLEPEADTHALATDQDELRPTCATCDRLVTPRHFEMLPDHVRSTRPGSIPYTEVRASGAPIGPQVGQGVRVVDVVDKLAQS